MKTPERDSYFDILRGLAIIFIVGIHSINVTFDYHSATGFLIILVRQIIGCGVPIFIAISGYFLVKKSLKSGSEYIAFLKRHLPMVYIPTLVWSVPYLIEAAVLGENIFTSLLLFVTCGFSIYYFTAAIIQCYLLLPVVKSKNFLFTLALLLLSLTWTLYQVNFNFIPQAQCPMVLYAAPFPNLLVFFSLGCWLGNKTRCYSWVVVAALLVISLGLSIYETYYLKGHFHILGLGMKPSANLFAFFVIMVLFHPATKRWVTKRNFASWLSVWGINSFFIYLTHLLAARVVFGIPFIRDFWLSKWVVLLAVAALMVIATKKIVPQKVWRYVGLR